jgi:dynamin family protein
MTAPDEQAGLAQAAGVVDLGIRAAEAYGRDDLAGRLTTLRRGLADPVINVVVAGEFKQGKSSLVNALVGANVCPVDDDVATAVPTYVRNGAQPQAYVLIEPAPDRGPGLSAPGLTSPAATRTDEAALRRVPVDPAQARRYVVESAPIGAVPDPSLPGPGERVAGVEMWLPRQLLAGGLVLVDTPGVGGLGSAHAAASLAAIATADAVIFVTDASQELTRSELDFLTQARKLCPAVLCVITKIDFYPAWRTVRDLDQRHLAPLRDIGLLAVSSSLRSRAVRTNDREVNAESGFADLVSFVSGRVGGGVANRVAAQAADDVMSVCDQIVAQFEAERAALADPAAVQAIVDDLNIAKRRVEALRSSAAKWNQTLSDGVGDLSSDIDHDLRGRIRIVTQEADDSVENVDPADMWPQMEAWLKARVSYELLENYTLLRERADALSLEVAEHFRIASGEVFDAPAVYNPTPLLSAAQVHHQIELEKMKAGKQAMVALRSGYGGAIMFTMLSTMMHVALGPISLGIGLVMGHKGLREEKKRQLTARRNQARNAVRRYCDEVNFLMGKDSRDTLRRIQRQLRDHYSALAEELSRSNQEALNAAAEAAKQTETQRATRLRNLEAELTRLRGLRDRAQALASSLVDADRGAAVR